MDLRGFGLYLSLTINQALLLSDILPTSLTFKFFAYQPYHCPIDNRTLANLVTVFNGLLV